MSERELMEQLDQTIDALLAGAESTSADPALSGLMKVAGRLRHLPDDAFKTRLIRELQFQRRAPMIHKISPFICVVEGDRLIEFMKQTFDAVVTDRHAHHGPDGFVANVRIGTYDLIVMGGESVRGQESTAALYLHTDDVDALYQRALAAGGISFLPPADQPFGDRLAILQDPFGNRWFLAKRIAR